MLSQAKRPPPPAHGGYVWIAGRFLYWHGYSQAIEKRNTGFAIQSMSATALWAGALGMIVWRLLRA